MGEELNPRLEKIFLLVIVYIVNSQRPTYRLTFPAIVHYLLTNSQQSSQFLSHGLTHSHNGLPSLTHDGLQFIISR